MKYRGYEIIENSSGVLVKNVRDFDPSHIFECGQCFRWNREIDGSYTGIAFGRVINVHRDGENILINNTGADDFKNIWYEYFDLGTDYSEIKSAVAKDDIMRRAVSYGCGMRILRQEFWETLISFIISSNNNIPRIMKIIEKLSAQCGEEINYGNKTYHTFPSAAALSNASPEEIGICRGGYRCGYISGTSAKMEIARIDKKNLEKKSTPDARKTLLEFPGVGPKVADCVLLYSGIKFDVFPTDVWVKRVMESLYIHKPASLGKIQSFAAERFGALAGFAQQYLFYYARKNKLS